jgi:glycogen debranching enzyme
MLLTILEGSTFAISDDLGDMVDGVHGFYTDDTRLLSCSKLTVDGAPPLLLTSQVVEYFDSAHYLRNAPTDTVPVDTISVARERFVGESLTERFVLRNETSTPRTVTVGLELASDFADIISVKAHDFALGDPSRAEPLPPRVYPVQTAPATLELQDPASSWSTRITFSRPVELAGNRASFAVPLEPRGTWELVARTGRGDLLPRRGVAKPRFGSELEHVRRSLDVWRVHVPRLRSDWSELERCFERSLADLASLRLKGPEWSHDLPAAGMPWFMTLFGRDTLITSLQTMLFGPELAMAALRALAALQATEDNAAIDAEPGKILHELRRGKAAESWFPIYYGTVDATPLFLVLLSEVWRWTGDDALVRELEPAARAALAWTERRGDLDGDGFVEYARRAPNGLANQSWKDSGDSQQFRDGGLADGPIAPAEVQGYVYDARLRVAELAREVWQDAALAVELQRGAESLRDRFDRAFWLEERGAYALALDRDKRPVDSLCSNNGHLLWSGIVPEARVGSVAAALASDDLWSGWGIRTMGRGEAGYNPLGYHTGTVWPHDTMLAAWGLARAGAWEQAWQLVRGLLEAARFFDQSLPEVFAGYPRSETAFPVAYPTAARPQAWAAGAPILGLRLLLGLRPDLSHRALVTDVEGPLPEWVGDLTLTGVAAFGRRYDVRIRDRRIEVAPAA